MPAAALSGHLFLSQETSSSILLLPKPQGEQELPEFYLSLSIAQSPRTTLPFPTRLVRPEPLPVRPLDAPISSGLFQPKPRRQSLASCASIFGNLEKTCEAYLSGLGGMYLKWYKDNYGCQEDMSDV